MLNAARYWGLECLANKFQEATQAKVALRECIANLERDTFPDHATRYQK
jgi:hypothetical protein